jgi:uncharacterized protein (TIGR02186 family)
LGRSGDQDLVVVIRGPALDMTVRRKQRMFGIWVNQRADRVLRIARITTSSRSTRPLDDIAPFRRRSGFRLGTANLEYQIPPGIDRVEATRSAPQRSAIASVRDSIGRARRDRVPRRARCSARALPCPPPVPPGLYRAEVYLFQGGTVVSAQSSPLFIDKTGFERRVLRLRVSALARLRHSRPA